MNQEQKWRKVLSCALKNSVKESREKTSARKTRLVRRMELSEADLSKDAQKLLKKTASRMYHPDSMSVDRFYIASVAAELIDKGLDAEFARGYVVDALTMANYSSLDENDPLDKLISLCPEDMLHDALSQCLKTASNNQLWLPLRFANACSGMDYEEQIAIYDEVNAAGFDGSAFLAYSMKDIKPETAIEKIKELEGDVRLHSAAAFGASFHDADDVLAYIYACREIGIMPSEVYPDGAEISYTLTGRLDQTGNEFTPNRSNKYIILSRMEKPVLAQADKVSADHSNNDSDGSDKTDTNNFTCRLETGYMDSLPMENLAASLEECDTAIILDTVFIEDGIIVFSAGSENEFLESAMESILPDYVYNTYACHQSVGLLDLTTGNPLFCFAEELTPSPENDPVHLTLFPSDFISTGRFSDFTNEQLLSDCCAQPIENWHDPYVKELISLMEELDWMGEYLLPYMISEA